MIHATALLEANSLDKATKAHIHAPHLRDCGQHNTQAVRRGKLIEKFVEGCRSKKTGAWASQVC
jgi:hypothetical protein